MESTLNYNYLYFHIPNYLKRNNRIKEIITYLNVIDGDINLTGRNFREINPSE